MTTEAERAAAAEDMEAYRRVYGSLRERTPRPQGDWQFGGHPPAQWATISSSVWRSGPVCVISSLIMAELPGGGGVGPQWLMSVSHNGKKRAKPHEVRQALRAFGMEEAEQDNHHPGVARHYFLVVDEALRVACECKTDEVVVLDGDHYAWTNPVGGDEDSAKCRGCELARLMTTIGRERPCPIHEPRMSP